MKWIQTCIVLKFKACLVFLCYRLWTWDILCGKFWKCQKSSFNKNKNEFILTVNLLFRFLNLCQDLFVETSLTDRIQFNNSIWQIFGEYHLCAGSWRNAKFRSHSPFTTQGFHSFPINIRCINEQSPTWKTDKAWVQF